MDRGTCEEQDGPFRRAARAGWNPETDTRRHAMTYTRLPTSHLDKSAGLLRPACILPERVALDNPALDVMTDFRRLTAFIATPGDTIKQAEERMIRRKVRLLFVMDSLDRVAGIITPVDRLEAVDYDDIAHARVGHVLETLKARGRQHSLVIEHTEGRQMVRGLLSLSQLCKQLGVVVETTEVADTFTEIEQQLAHA